MFKDIPGYEGLYQINENGEIINTKSGHIKTPRISTNGRYTVQLWKHNKGKNRSVHRLIALTFIENPNNLPVVMHLDNNPLNNDISNLKWGTYSENTKQAYDDGLISKPTIHSPYRYYEIYNDNNTISKLCKGYYETQNTIEYGTIATIHNAVSQNGQLRYGPYKGCRIRKLFNGVTYENN